jgi:hypothetical protein
MSRAKQKSTLVAVEPLKPPPFVVSPEMVTGTYDSGDVLENVLDELRAILMAVERIHALEDGSDNPMGNLIPMALRKAEAAATLYDNIHAVWAAKDGAS